MQYFIGYVLGQQEDSNKAAEKGTIVHKVLEVLGNCRKDQIDRGLDSRDVPDLYTDSFVDDQIKYWYEYYTDKSVHKDKFKNADWNDCFKWTHMALDYNGGQFDPRKRDIFGVEVKFDIAIEEPWGAFEYELPDGSTIEGQLAIKGTVDLVTRDNGGLEVIDWKTGARKNWATGEEYTYSKLMNNPQLLLYYYALTKTYPEFADDLIMTIFYIKAGGPFSLCFGELDKVKFLEMLRLRVQEIQKCVRPKMLSPKQTHFKCTRMCHFYKNKYKPEDKDNMCMTTKKMINKHGIDVTVAQLTAEGHSIDYYHDPGS